eukprot:126348-Prorocentrum_minimum.AAC.2
MGLEDAAAPARVPLSCWVSPPGCGGVAGDFGDFSSPSECTSQERAGLIETAEEGGLAPNRWQGIGVLAVRPSWLLGGCLGAAVVPPGCVTGLTPALVLANFWLDACIDCVRRSKFDSCVAGACGTESLGGSLGRHWRVIRGSLGGWGVICIRRSASDHRFAGACGRESLGRFKRAIRGVCKVLLGALGKVLRALGKVLLGR